MGRPGPAERAGGGRVNGYCTDPQSVALSFDALNGQPTRSKRDSMTHGGDPRPIRRPRSRQNASALSLSRKGDPVRYGRSNRVANSGEVY